ncbi:suppressor protein Stm1p [[Candida] jaroonii]|uniref:Suppressor protein Stm1p n=1 Tax=[Candida] jaroonii TaxID=467808 RepID=A0ACA9YG46_9ASCO|nr:suppressor protein Stm1p [[Candida] jaroonii]
MSFENKNLFHLLGNDVEDEEPILATKEVVKKGTSSKKSDEPPAKADPSKAKNKKKVGGNEGAYKTKIDNKSVSAPSSTPSKHYKKPLDRQSRSNKKDSSKKVSQGWGSKDGEANLEDEVEAEEDAVAELAEDDETVVEDVPKRSLNDYFEELKLKQAELDGQKVIRSANQGAEDKWTAEEKIIKQREEYFSATAEKKTRTKAQKEKKFLEIEATFADQTPVSSRGARGSSRGPRGASRGRGSAPRGRGAPRGKPSAPKADASSKINLADDKKFPSL